MPLAGPSRGAARIAINCSDESVLPFMQETLAPFFHITVLNAAEDILPVHQETPLDAVILDVDPAAPGARDGCQLLRELRANDQDVLLFAITRVRSRHQRLRAQTAGADVVLIAPADCGQLRLQLEQSLADRQFEIEHRQLQEEA